MTEWGIVEVIVVLVGLFLTVGKPVVNLTNKITRLTDTVSTLQSDITDFANKNAKSHRELWAKNEKQDEMLLDHEKRISVLEERK